MSEIEAIVTLQFIIGLIAGGIISWWVTRRVTIQSIYNINAVEIEFEGQNDEKPTQWILHNTGTVPLENLVVSIKVSVEQTERLFIQEHIPKLKVRQPTIICIQKDLEKLFKELGLIFFGETEVDYGEDFDYPTIAAPKDKLFFEICLDAYLSRDTKSRQVVPYKLKWTSWEDHETRTPKQDYCLHSRIEQTE